MKIETLSISGLRSHRGDPATEVNLTGKSLVAIVGPTGAGKSSVLEAVCFALYGEATFGGKAYRELSSDGCSEISVQMTFTVGEDRYQLVRSVAPNRKGVFGAKATWLRKLDGDGNVLTHTDQVRKVDSAIRALLGGMDRVQFCQAVLLAQNRFAELLEADERKRNELLDILLGLTALADARRALLVTDRAAQRNEERLSDRRAGIPSDPANAAKVAAARAAAMKELLGRAEAGAAVLRSLVNNATCLDQKAASIRAAVALRYAGGDGFERLREVVTELESLANEERRIASDLDEAHRGRRESGEALKRAERAVEAAEREHGRSGAHDVIIQQVDELGRLIGDHRRHRVDLGEACDALEAVARQLDAARKLKAAAEADLQGKAEAADNAREAAQDARGKVDERQRQVDAVSQLTGELDVVVVDELASALDRLARADGDAISTAAPVGEAATAWREAAENLELAQQVAAAAAAAHGHHPGNPCPVCDRQLPEGWQPPKSPDLDRAREAEKDAKNAYEKVLGASQKVTERRGRAAEAYLAVTAILTAKLSAVVLAAEEHGLPLPTLRDLPEIPADAPLETAREAVDEANRLREVVAAWRTDLDGVLIPLRDNAVAAARTLNVIEQAAVAARSRLQETGQVVADLEKEEVRLKEAERGSASAIQTTVKRIDDLRPRIPERWASLISADASDPAKAATDACLADARAVAGAVESRDLAAAALTRIEQRISSLNEERVASVSESFAIARGELRGLVEAVRALVRLVGLTEPVEPSDTATLLETLKAASAAFSAAGQARATASERIEELERQRQALAEPASAAIEGLLELKAQADPERAWITAAPDPDDPLSPATSEAVQQVVGAASAAASAARREASAAKADVKTAKELDQRLQALAAWRADLAGAAEALRKENFPAWARDQRIAELVDTASQLLSGMTGGRYRFDSHLRIIDDVAGAVRAATTLSGGEKFEAALALALSVAEIAGRSGIRFDTLFLDEGFAGLDQQNLDRALDALEDEVEQGRRVVLITHIGAVADRIRDVLFVEPDGMGGSKTRWLDEEERFELGADLDLTDAGRRD